jgi:ribosome-binding factor A
MSSDRITRVNEILRREIAEGIPRVMNGTEFDLAAATVTHVVTSRNLRHARVLVSIRGDDAHAKKMLSLLRKRAAEIQRRINSNLELKYTPKLSFERDSSIEQGHRVLDLLAEIEEAETGDPS